MIMFRLASVAALLVFALGSVYPQTPDAAVKFRLAQSYEQAGNFEDAATLYKELLAKDQSNFVYVDALRRVYMQLKRYDDAIILLKNRLAAAPGDANTRAVLGGVYYKAGNEKGAHAEWNATIVSEPANPNIYRIVANIMIENRLLDKTAEVYRKARIACSDPNLFTIDLAQLLAVSMDYTGATTEFLRWLKQNPTQLSFVQGRMATFTGKEEGRIAALGAVHAEIVREENPRLYELLGWLHLEGKNFADALEAYKTLDRITNARGGQIYAFAERAFKEKAFAVAARAYKEAIDMPIAQQRLPYAKYGYACSLKELTTLADTLATFPSGGSEQQSNRYPVTESRPQYSGAIGYFQEIIKEYPRSEFSARSYFQIGMIQFEKYFDLDGALASFQHVEEELPGLAVVQHDVTLTIGDVLTAKGDTAQAAARFARVLNTPTATPDQTDEASYRIAELEYFGGRFQDAIRRLGEITLNLKADYANDALQLLTFLQENTTTAELALREFARADFLARQRKNTEAIPLFLQIIDRYPQALLVDDALMKMASLQAQARMFTDAIASYGRLLSQFKESSIALDIAQFNIGEIYQFGMNDIPNAMKSYEQLLSGFPQSIHATTARKRIRELRGDSL